jgi:hypothetical protein
VVLAGLAVVVAGGVAVKYAKMRGEMPLATFKATMPRQPTELYVYGYNDVPLTGVHYPGDTYWCLHIRDDTSSMWAHVLKSSPEAKSLLDVVRDGREHAMWLTLKYEHGSPDNALVVRWRSP